MNTKGYNVDTNIVLAASELVVLGARESLKSIATSVFSLKPIFISRQRPLTQTLLPETSSQRQKTERQVKKMEKNE